MLAIFAELTAISRELTAKHGPRAGESWNESELISLDSMVRAKGRELAKGKPPAGESWKAARIELAKRKARQRSPYRFELT